MIIDLDVLRKYEEDKLITCRAHENGELLIWNYTVPKTGQFDLRLVIDYVNVIDEYDEGNNYNHMVVTGASIGSPGLVPSFAPSVLLVLLAGFAISVFQRRTRD